MKVFLEEQRFNQWWFRLLLVIIAIITILVVAKSYSELENDATAFWISIFTGGFTILLLFLIAFSFKLKTRIDEQGIHYGFWPFHLKLKTTRWSEIEKCYVTEYNPIADYGGWGYKVVSFRKKGAALNVKGNIGIQIVFKDGKKLLIGTQKEEEAKKVLETYKNKL